MMDKEAIADDPLPSTGINRDSLAPIFEDETETPAAAITNEDGLSVSELAKKLNMTRQSIEGRRDKGTLSEVGYKATKIGGRWKYFHL